MITTKIKLHFHSKNRKEVSQTLDRLSMQDLKAEGCRKAEVWRDVDDKNILYFVEEWASDKALEKHKRSKTMGVLFGLQYLLVEGLQTQTMQSVTMGEICES